MSDDAARYRAMRAYTQSVRDWYDRYPDHQPGELQEGKERPWFGFGVVLCVTADRLDALCDEWIAGDRHGQMP